ncbi:hypothetical protein [Teichococcus wenyumeiae]|uniref:hypothetical protein n=1 Tax=Teichococcus wenyumeiae TaxID=2478470 RepID=UPI0011C430DB|nr:hypothetical protein [Pseudoroseomonas wenyumeiae]
MPTLDAFLAILPPWLLSNFYLVKLAIAVLGGLISGYVAAAIMRRRGITFSARAYFKLMQIQVLSFPFAVLFGATILGPVVNILGLLLAFLVFYTCINIGFAARMFRPIGPAKRFTIIPSDAVHNERLKLRSAWLNSISTMVMTAGIASPAAAIAFNIGDFQAKASLPLVALGSGICFWFSVMLHMRATRTLGGLR